MLFKSFRFSLFRCSSQQVIAMQAALHHIHFLGTPCGPHAEKSNFSSHYICAKVLESKVPKGELRSMTATTTTLICEYVVLKTEYFSQPI